MTWDFNIYACLGLGLTTALVAGTFQSFSDFVMAGLVRAEPRGGIEVMQHINRTVFRSVFLASFIALVPLTLGYAIYAFLKLDGSGQTLIIAGAIVYVLTVFLVTAFGNVPMNEQLDKLNYSTDEAATYWDIYGRDWTRWNHVRTFGAVASAACYLMAAVNLSPQ